MEEAHAERAVGTPPPFERARSPRIRAGLVLAWLTLALGLAVSLICIAYVYWPGPDGLIRRGGRIAAYKGGDFLNLFVAAKLVLAQRALDAFNLKAYLAAARSLTSPAIPFYSWSYPPTFLLLIAPLAFARYDAGFLLWTIATGAALAAALWSTAPNGRIGALALAAVLASPSALINIADGQNGALTAALFLAGVRLMDDDPLLAGAFFGFLTIKPQLGILIPVALLARANWRAMAMAAIAAAALAAISALAFGAQAWVGFVRITSAYQLHLLDAMRGFYIFMMPSPFAAARLLGAGVSAATAIQAGAFLVAVIMAWRAARLDVPRRLLALACLALVATPYSMIYDETLVAAASVVYLIARPRPTFAALASISAAWLWPAFSFLINPSWPLGPLLLFAPALLIVTGLDVEGAGARLARRLKPGPLAWRAWTLSRLE